VVLYTANGVYRGRVVRLAVEQERRTSDGWHPRTKPGQFRRGRVCGLRPAVRKTA